MRATNGASGPMGDGEPGRVSRKAPRFFGLPDDAVEADASAPADGGVSTEAPTPLRPATAAAAVVEAPLEDPQAADTAELLVDPVARREVGAIVEARHLLADARDLLRQQSRRRVAQPPVAAEDDVGVPAEDDEVVATDVATGGADDD